MAQGLRVKRVQNSVAGAVCRGAGALGGGAFAIFRRHAAEGALIDFAFFGAAEGHAVMFKLDNGIGRVFAHIFDGVLVTQPVGAFDGIIEMPAPVIGPHIAERGRNAALRRHGVRTGGEYFGEACGRKPLFGHAEGSPQASAASTHHNHIIKMVGDGIGAAVDGWRFIDEFGLVDHWLSPDKVKTHDGKNASKACDEHGGVHE